MNEIMENKYRKAIIEMNKQFNSKGIMFTEVREQMNETEKESK